MAGNDGRAQRIGGSWSYPQSRAFAELLIDCGEDRTARAVLVGMRREPEGGKSIYFSPVVASRKKEPGGQERRPRHTEAEQRRISQQEVFGRLPSAAVNE
jgi:hypothetical protein